MAYSDVYFSYLAGFVARHYYLYLQSFLFLFLSLLSNLQLSKCPQH